MNTNIDENGVPNMYKKCSKMGGKLLDDNVNNGLITKIWGPPLWTSLHSITFGYPIHPTPEQKEDYKTFFRLLGQVMPCKYCRESYQQFISDGNTKLIDDVMNNRESLTRWLYDVHNAVNNKLGVDYGITYEDVVTRYEAYRAKCSKGDKLKIKGCVTPLNDKQLSYKMANYKECSIISLYIAKELVDYAKLRNIPYDGFIDEYVNNMEQHKTQGHTNCDAWYDRNINCSDTILKMRVNGIPSLETSGKFNGLPTIDEMSLILKLASNLSKDELLEVLNKWNEYKKKNNVHVKKKYKLIYRKY